MLGNSLNGHQSMAQKVDRLYVLEEKVSRAGTDRLMEVLMRRNYKHGRGTLYPAGQGMQQHWWMKREMLSPRYTTRYSDLLVVK